MARRGLHFLVALLAVTLFLRAASSIAGENGVRVYAAASLAPAFGEISELAEKLGLPGCVCVHAASSTLARQIERGAPADIYISANAKWVDYLASRGAIGEDHREMARGRLALIAPLNSLIAYRFDGARSLGNVLGNDWLALADPDHVPAGLYARAGLEKLGLWQGLQGRIARAANVRAALALVVRGEASVGVVYESDAKTEPRVRILDRFPASSHLPVRYMMAAIEKQPAPDVGVYMDFLTSASVRAILTKHGFLPPRDPRH